MSDVVCSICGRTHDQAESELYFVPPDEIFALSDEERGARCKRASDVCILDDKRFYVRGLLPIPVAGRVKPYSIGVWAEVNFESFARINDLWSDPAQEKEPPMPGVLSNRIPYHPNTLALHLRIQLTGPKTRPNFYLEEADNSLFTEQTRGIDEHRALQYSDRSRRKSAV